MLEENVISENWIDQWIEYKIRNTYPEHDEHWNYKHKFPIEQLLSEFGEQKVFVWKKKSGKILIKQIIQLGMNSGNTILSTKILFFFQIRQ